MREKAFRNLLKVRDLSCSRKGQNLELLRPMLKSQDEVNVLPEALRKIPCSEILLTKDSFFR